jgi:hypothetical protein
LTRHVEQRHPELGPVATWHGDALVLILAGDHSDAATAAEQSMRVVQDALQAVKLAGRLARVLQVEALGEPSAASAA